MHSTPSCPNTLTRPSAVPTCPHSARGAAWTCSWCKNERALLATSMNTQKGCEVEGVYRNVTGARLAHREEALDWVVGQSIGGLWEAGVPKEAGLQALWMSEHHPQASALRFERPCGAWSPSSAFLVGSQPAVFGLRTRSSLSHGGDVTAKLTSE